MGVSSEQACIRLSILIDRSHQCWTSSACYDPLTTPWWLIDSNTFVYFPFIQSIQDMSIRSLPLIRISVRFNI